MSDVEVQGMYLWEKLDKNILTNSQLKKIVCSKNSQAVKEKAAELWLDRLAKEEIKLGRCRYGDDLYYEQLNAWFVIIANVESLKEKMSKLILGKEAYEEIYDNYAVILEYGDRESRIKLAKEIIGYSLNDGEEYFWLAINYVPEITEMAFQKTVHMYELGKWGWVGGYKNWHVFVNMENEKLALRASEIYLKMASHYTGYKATTLLKIVERFSTKRKQVIDIFLSKYKEMEDLVKNINNLLRSLPELELVLSKLERGVVKDNNYYLNQLVSVGQE